MPGVNGLCCTALIASIESVVNFFPVISKKNEKKQNKFHEDRRCFCREPNSSLPNITHTIPAKQILLSECYEVNTNIHIYVSRYKRVL
jgi:hypothetical protein